MDNYFNFENLKKNFDENLAKRIALVYNLLTPIRAMDNKYDPEILTIHQDFTNQLISSLKDVKSWEDYSDFIHNQMIHEERTRLKICSLMHPSYRKSKGLPTYLETQIQNVSNLWGTALTHLLTQEYTFINIKIKQIQDSYSLSIGEQSNIVALNSFTDQFFAGCEWAMTDNEKVAENIKLNTPISNSSFQDFIQDNGFDFIRYPLVHENNKDQFLSYLTSCCKILSDEYCISQNKLGFNQNGLELCTTNSPAYYMPSMKCISLRLDMINAFFHEHFHALDHQVLLGINTKQLQTNNNQYVEYSLASEISLNTDSKIDDSPSKNILLEFNTASKNLISARDSSNKEIDFTTEEQNERKSNIVSMTKRFLEEIASKLNLDPTPFNPVIDLIMADFTSIPKSNDFELSIDEKLSTLTNEKFEEKHKNYYVEMTKRIHKLYNKMNNKTLFYNFSLISDNGKPSYFATIPEMLARSAESYFFNKYPKTNITPPEWWETNSYLFYPQGEEKELIYKNFFKVIDTIKNNATEFENNLGKQNNKKSFKL